MRLSEKRKRTMLGRGAWPLREANLLFASPNGVPRPRQVEPGKETDTRPASRKDMMDERRRQIQRRQIAAFIILAIIIIIFFFILVK